MMRDFSVVKLVHKITPRFTGYRDLESTCGQPFRQVEDVFLASPYGCTVNNEQNRLRRSHQDTFL
jgi:hypothetical protein